MKARLNGKAKILTAAVLCACTTLWANPVWAQQVLGGIVLVGNDVQETNNVENKEVVMDSSVNNGEVKGVYGGYAMGAYDDWGNIVPSLEGSLEANYNKVTINSGEVTGGEIVLKAIGSNYTLKIDNGVVAGGYANYASHNEVIMNDGLVETDIYGGFSQVSNNEKKEHPEITDNHVYIYGGNVTGGNIAGAYVNTNRENGNKNTLSNNSVTIQNAVIKSTENSNGNVYGAWADDRNAVLSCNKVYIKDGANITTAKGSNQYGMGIFGAFGQTNYTSAVNNIVEISGGTINGDVYGAFANTGNAGNSNAGIVSGNQVVIKGGTIIGNIYAGDSQQGVNIENNSILLNGNANLSEANLYGWKNTNDTYVKKGIKLEANSFIGNAGNIERFNNVNITNNSQLNVEEIDLYTNYDKDYNEVCGNLTVDNSTLNANEIGYVNQLTVQNGATLEANTVDLYNNSELNGALVANNADIKIVNFGYSKNISLINSNADINKLYDFDSLTINNLNQKIVDLGNISGYSGGKVTTITTDSKFTADSIKDLKELNVDMTAINWEKDSAVIDVSGTADLTGTDISATGILAAEAGTEVQNGDTMSFIKAGTLTGAKAEDVNIEKLQIGFATEADVEVQDGENSIDFVITGAQRANEQAGVIGESRTAAIAFVNQGSDILNNAFGLLDDGKYGIKTFAAVHGNYSKYDTGSHIRVNGWSMIAGVGSSEKYNDGNFSWGVFFENGSGNYRTYNDYNGFNLKGFGSAVYNGGGAMARYRSDAGNYVEAGLRAGMLKNSLSNAVVDGYGMQGGYDEETSYYGAHLGLGHIFELDDRSNIDVYGKYFYTHHDSEDFEVLGDEVSFDSADSNRLRLGMRYNQNDGNAFSHYYGLAWDYEFSGNADVTAAGFDTGNPSLKGSTAVVEAGIHYAPDKSPWSIDLGLQGYGGQRDGFSGTMQVNYTF